MDTLWRARQRAVRWGARERTSGQPCWRISASNRPMPESRPPDAETFARQFRRKYGREMSDAERRFYELTKDLLDHPPEEEDEDGSAA